MIDRLLRLLYLLAYRAMRVYWAMARPRTHGALVALWSGGEILLVRNSYTRYHSLPGGYVRRRESPLEAARRELLEEVGLSLGSGELCRVVDVHHLWEGKRDHVEVFEADLSQRPEVRVDGREVVAAAFYPPARALALDLFPPVRQAIEQRAGRTAGAGETGSAVAPGAAAARPGG
ncbi:MAG TPA: NUDIX hydrolase [Anaeromyxobacter sp.]|nr:NUDIX hydrolase [Anaeromyxobacter sp.]